MLLEEKLDETLFEIRDVKDYPVLYTAILEDFLFNREKGCVICCLEYKYGGFIYGRENSRYE